MELEGETNEDASLSEISRRYKSSVPNIKEIVERLAKMGYMVERPKGKYVSYSVAIDHFGQSFSRAKARRAWLKIEQLISRTEANEERVAELESSLEQTRSALKARRERSELIDAEQALKRLTKAQRAALDAAHRAQTKLRQRPSLAEVAAERHQPPHVVAKHLPALANEGYLRYEPDGRYSVLRSATGAVVFPPPALTATPSRGARAETSVRQPLVQVLETALELAMAPDAVDLSILGFVAAGKPVEAVGRSSTLSIPVDWTRGHDCYLLIVRGDSMVGDGILDGDIVLVREQDHVEPGAIHICWVPNVGATIKRVQTTEDAATLVASNPQFAPIAAPEGTIVQGRVVKVIRDLE